MDEYENWQEWHLHTDHTLFVVLVESGPTETAEMERAKTVVNLARASTVLFPIVTYNLRNQDQCLN